MNFLPPPPLPLARKVIRASRKLKRFGPWRPVLTSCCRVLAACACGKVRVRVKVRVAYLQVHGPLRVRGSGVRL